MTTVCEYCKCEFTQRRDRAPTRFCGRSCSAQARDKSTYKGTFPKGKKPWNSGKKNWRVGYSHSQETRSKIGSSNSGENSSLWKGGISHENERLRKTATYKAWRQSVFKRDDFRCQTCGARSSVGHRVTLHADHIKPFATCIEGRFDVCNGRTLCAPCHRKTPTYGNSRCKQEINIKILEHK